MSFKNPPRTKMEMKGGRRCRKCGCTQFKACVRKKRGTHVIAGNTCFWVEPDLCSACVSPAVREKFHYPVKRFNL
jgi:hypothetical protein